MKKFILIFLTIIFTTYHRVQGLELLLHYVIDDVSAGSYNYYSLFYEGPIKLLLKSNSGDADIYVSQKTTKPTYDPDNNCLQSTTCGEDEIYVPKNFNRPVSIGIYGHPSHNSSRYTLMVSLINDKDENFPDQFKVNDNFQEIVSNKISGNDNLQKEKQTSFAKSLRSILMHFLELFTFTVHFGNL